MTVAQTQIIEWLGLAGGALLLGRCALSGARQRSWIDAGAWGFVLLPLLLSSTVFAALLVGGSVPGPVGTTAVILGAAALLRILARRSARAADALALASEKQAAGPTGPAPYDPASAPTAPDSGDPASPPSPLRRALWLLPLAAAAMAVWAAGDWGDPIPGGSWDSMAIWNTGARVLVRGTSDWPALFSDRVIGHPDYPLMVPATLASVWSAVGGESPTAPRSVALAFLLGLGLMTLSSVRRFCGSTCAAFAATLVLGTPILAEMVRAQLADTALALVLLATVSALASRFSADPRRRLPAWLAGLAWGALPWCKNEGAVLALVVAAAYLLCSWLQRGTRLGARGELLALAAGAVLPLGVLVAFKMAWAPDDPMFSDVGTTLLTHLPDPSRWANAWKGFADQLNPWADGSIWGLETSFDRWGYAWPATALVALIGLVRGRPFQPDHRLFLGLVAVGCLAAYFAVYVTTPARSQTWHIETSLFRLLLQIFPTVLLWACATATAKSDTDPAP